jgi:hypothetical protein
MRTEERTSFGRAARRTRGLEQTHEVAWEYVSARLSSRFVKKFATPPSVFGGIRHCDDIPRLEIKLFVNGSRVIIESFHYEVFKERNEHKPSQTKM